MKTYNFFQYMAISLKSMTFRDALMLISVLVLILFAITFVEYVLKALVLLAVLFAVCKAVESLCALLVNLIGRRGYEDDTSTCVIAYA
jgi:hypothetical protein